MGGEKPSTEMNETMKLAGRNFERTVVNEVANSQKVNVIQGKWKIKINDTAKN